MTTTEKITSGFPHPIIPPILGVANYESIKTLQKALNANAASVHSNLGDGRLGLLALTVSQAVYDTLSDTAFVPLPNPARSNSPSPRTVVYIVAKSI
jgi:hypothetical protein